MKQLIILLGITFQSIAFAGDKGHGGDPVLIDQAQIKLFLNKKAKSELKLIINWVLNTATTTDDPTYKKLIVDLASQGLLRDIDLSLYEYKDECRDYKNELKGAVSLENDKKGAVCWSLNFLSSKKPTQSQLVALAFHEHIHHFGIADEDHSLAAQFQELYLAKLGKTLPLNPDVKKSWNHFEGSLQLSRYESGIVSKFYKKIKFKAVAEITTGFCEFKMMNKNYSCTVSTSEALRLFDKGGSHGHGYSDYHTLNIMLTSDSFIEVLLDMGLNPSAELPSLTENISYIKIVTLEKAKPYVPGVYFASFRYKDNDLEVLEFSTKNILEDFKVRIRLDSCRF